MLKVEELQPVDVTLAQEEILKHSGEGWLDLSPEAQHQLIASYQQGRIAEAALKDVKDRALFRKLSAMKSQGRDHAALIVDSCFGLVWSKLRAKAVARMGESWTNRSSDDLKAEVNAFILEKASGFNPEVNSSFKAYLSSQVSALVGSVLKGVGRSGSMPDAWERVLRMVAAILQDGRAKGLEVSREEVVASLEIGFKKWAEDKMTLEELELGEAARIEVQRKKLSKSGMLSALKDIDSLIILASGEVRLDATLGSESSGTFADVYAGTVDVEGQVFGEDPEAALRRVYKVALGDQSGDLHTLMAAYHGLLGQVEGFATLDPDSLMAEGSARKAWSLNSLSDRSGFERVEVRNVLKDRARARLAAPHAQFAHLAFEVDLQFEVESKDILSEVRAMPREMFADF